MKLYLEKALLLAEYNGIINPRKQIREKMWPESSLRSQKQNLTNVITEFTQATPEIIRIFCDVCNVKPNFIYDGPE